MCLPVCACLTCLPDESMCACLYTPVLCACPDVPAYVCLLVCACLCVPAYVCLPVLHRQPLSRLTWRCSGRRVEQVDGMGRMLGHVCARTASPHEGVRLPSTLAWGQVLLWCRLTDEAVHIAGMSRYVSRDVHSLTH